MDFLAIPYEGDTQYTHIYLRTFSNAIIINIYSTWKNKVVTIEHTALSNSVTKQLDEEKAEQCDPYNVQCFMKGCQIKLHLEYAETN